MTKKKIILLSMLIICLIGLSAVSATGNTTDEMLDTDYSSDSETVSIEDDDIINSTDDDILSDAGTYSALKTRIDGASSSGTTYLYNDYSLSSGYSTSGITISKQMTLDGNGYTIDAKSNCRVFYISGQNVVLKNIVFKNAYYSGNGGAIYWSGSGGSIINCTFINDYSNYGGAVYWDGSSGKIINSTFTGNHAYYNGGAVYWHTTYGTIDGCSFNDNYLTRSSYYGGAVYWYSSNGNLKNSNFTNNKAYYGGAVYWTGNYGTLDNCNFNDNGPYNTYNYGGAVYWTGSNGNLKKSKFDSNKAFYNGGAVYWSGNSGTLDYSEFNNNTATNGNGGAVYWSGDSGTLDYSEFNNNTATNDYGGAIYWTNSNGKLKNTNFTNNHAYSRGGAVYWQGSSGIIDGCDFSDNALTASNGHGGAVYKEIYSADIQNSNFKNNNATYGGAMSFYTTSSDDIINCTFNDNIADYGEAIEWYSETCRISNSTFNGEKTNYDKYFYISSKLTPNIVLTAYDITLGQKLNLQVTFNDGICGNMTITLTNKDTGETVYSSFKKLINNFNLTIPNLKRGTYTVKANYTGDNIYKSSIITKDIRVIGWDSSVSFSVNDITWGTPVVLSPTVTYGATGFIEIYVNGYYKDTFRVGTQYTLTGLGGPSSSIELVYLGDDNYEPSSSSRTINVQRLDLNFVAPESIESGNPSAVEIRINEDASGNVRVTLNGNTYTGTATDGKFTFYASKLTSGTKSMTIEYMGDTKYNPFTETFYVKVTMRVPVIQLDVSNVRTGNTITIKPVVTSGATGTFNIYVDGIYKTQINYNSQYTLEAQPIGKHDVRVTYSGDSYYASSQNQTVFRVYKFYPIELQNTAIIYGSGKHFQAVFYDEYGDVLANKLVSFRIGGNDNVVITDKDGIAVLNTNFNIGNYSITTINTIVNEALTRNLEVFSSIQSQDMVRAYNTGIDFKVRLYGEDAKPLIKGYAIFNVNGKNYAVRTDNDGFATLNAGLQPGTYTVITTNALTSESKTNSLRIFSSINADNMVRGYNSGMDFRARFLDNNNIPLVNQMMTFKIGSKEYVASTDANGYAVLNEKLDVGKYQIQIFNRISGENCIRDLTITERIIENNDVIRIQGEESYFTIRVIGDDGNPVGANEIVKININKGSYEIRTDSKGYASFRIDENIGSYIISAEYKGFSVVNDVYVLEKVNYIQNINAGDISYKQTEWISTALNTFDKKATVEFIITSADNHKKTFTHMADSTIDFGVSDLNASRYTVTANYYDFNNYKYSTAVKTFNVYKIDPNIIISVNNANVGENASIVVNIPDVSGVVVIRVGNNLVYEENLVKNGVIVKNIANLDEGAYQVSVTYRGDNNYNMLTKTETLFIIQDKVKTTITANDITMTYGGAAYLVATLSDEYGNVLHDKNVSIHFNGLNSILTTDNTGQVKVKISNVGAKTYSAVITFVGDDIHAGTSKTVKVTILKPATKTVTKLTLKKVTVKRSAKKLVLQATLKINGKAVKKKSIKFKFNKKTYKAKTNKKGVAKVTIKKSVLKKLKKGKKITYTASYGKTTVKRTVKVK